MKSTGTKLSLKRNAALWSALLLAAIALAGCSGESVKGSGGEWVLEDPILIELTLSKEVAAVGEAVSMIAKVTQSGEPVDDADTVEFEITQEGGGMQVKVPAQHSGNGNYELQKRFTDTGTYRIVSHVTARGMHSMPVKELQVTP
ncbi:hypothetical protein E6C60_2042 [Paenibacillus algicola]|uniref:YtkA-like domain-containing protein n=1 Tax=Paenibacillus algicola TaxID=2565926 RepID=A0A4P8XJE0_9BACL|nr:FixH family protein [Paenibacillus algicola]QCT02757.1 hypothetical protein E6C60_2042 [Paenibacillus algicola]